MERELVAEFQQLRSRGLKVKHWWFRTRSVQLCNEKYPKADFKFSSSWFDGFKKRHRISYRAQTNIHESSASEKREKIENFHKFVRRVASRGEQDGEVGQFQLGDIVNVDQSPLPFAFMSGKTYANKGDDVVWVKGAGSGLDKRQCTLQVAVFADGVSRIKPMIVFRGKGLRIPQKEKDLYDRRVIVRFQENAWVDEAETLFWINHLYKPTCNDGRPKLFVADVHRAQKTDGVKKALLEINTTMALIPPGCTSLLQPLDVSVFSVLKSKLNVIQNKHMHDNLELYVNGNFTAGDRRVLITKWIGEVWTEVSRNNEMIRRSFVKTGIALSIDGTEDDKIHLEGMEEYEFPDDENSDDEDDLPLINLCRIDLMRR